MVFYLKINVDAAYTFNNLRIWLEAVAEFEGEKICYIICDSSELKSKVEEKVKFPDSVCIKFMDSHMYDKTEEMQRLLSICSGRFIGASRAHMITFMHAKENKYNRFWNIDADDTRICLSAKRISELMRYVERYADSNYIDIFSLDMLESRKKGIPGWTFGVTYTNNRLDFVEIINKHINDEERKKLWGIMDGVYAKNIDTYFTYLKHFSEIKAECFYFENMKFVHYYGDMLDRLHGSGFFHWERGYLKYPILFGFVGEEKYGCIPISKNAIKLDISITDDETMNSIEVYSTDWKEYYSSGESIKKEDKVKIYNFFKKE